jgi:two-component system, NarL family, response regulator LiaR
MTIVDTRDDARTDLLRQVTVAIVDDHDVFTEALSVRLGQEPDLRVVATTTSAERALDLVALHQPDVVVLDVELDLANGLDLSVDLRNGPHRPAVVILTCRDDRETAAAALRMGASAVVLKLGPIHDLITAIRCAFRGEAWVSPSLLTGLLAEMRSGPSDGADRSGIEELTSRELEILSLMVEGQRYAEIARRLGLSVNTVRTHAHNLQKKLNVHSRVAAISVGLRAGLRPATQRSLRW